MKIFTIGFTKSTAEDFFHRLRQPGLLRVVDVRLNNTSQLAGFAKKDDLRFFLRAVGGIGYVHQPALAPTQAMLDDYRNNGGDWARYARDFLALMAAREVETTVSRAMVDGGCFLCSEATADTCHRRLAAEYLQAKWGDVQIAHL